MGKNLKRGDIVWGIHYDKSAGESNMVTFAKAEIFEVRDPAQEGSHIMKPIKVYFDHQFSAEDNIPTLGLRIGQYQLFTDNELNHFQDKHTLMKLSSGGTSENH